MTTFDERVKEIADAEKDVDRVLDAARLSRNSMSDRRFETIMETITVLVAVTTPMVMMIIMMVMLRI